MAIKKITADQVKKLKGKTDWQEIDKLTDEEIEQAAKDDMRYGGRATLNIRR
jgi:hypothetical protein